VKHQNRFGGWYWAVVAFLTITLNALAQSTNDASAIATGATNTIGAAFDKFYGLAILMVVAGAVLIFVKWVRGKK